MAGTENIQAVVDGIHEIDITVLVVPGTLIEVVESRELAEVESCRSDGAVKKSLVGDLWCVNCN